MQMTQIKHILFAFIVLATATADAQVGVGTATPAPSAQLDIVSTTKGLLIPRMTSAQRIGIASPAEGLLVYQTDAPAGLYLVLSGVWTLIGQTGPQGPQGPAGAPATLTFSFLSKTADYTITSGDVTNNLVIKNSSNSVVTFTLPSASSAGTGKLIYITSTSTSSPQSINVLTDGSDLLFGFYTTPSGTTDISATTLSNISWIQLISDGTSWNVLGMYW